MKKQAVVLAGGLATRLYPLTEKIPKSMVDIKGKPFFEHQIALCRRNGIGEIVFCGGYLWEQVADYFGDGRRFGIKIEYSIEKEKLDTGGALKNAMNRLREEFFVVYGDSYLDIDWKSVWKFYKESKAKGLMTVYRNRPEDNLKSQITMSREGRIIEFTKENFTDSMKFIEYGLNILRRETMNKITEKTFPIGHYFNFLIERNQLIGYESPKVFQEIGSFEGIKKLTDLLD